MLTVESLREFGANTKDGLSRCMNNEGFYLRLVNMALDDPNFDTLASAVENDDKNAAFEAAHALKGTLANLSLTPLCEPVSEMTELLRAGRDADYAAYLSQIRGKRKALTELRNS